MDGHERLSNIILGHKLKKRNNTFTAILALSFIVTVVFNNKHNSYLTRIIQRPLSAVATRGSFRRSDQRERNIMTGLFGLNSYHKTSVK